MSDEDSSRIYFYIYYAYQTVAWNRLIDNQFLGHLAGTLAAIYHDVTAVTASMTILLRWMMWSPECADGLLVPPARSRGWGMGLEGVAGWLKKELHSVVGNYASKQRMYAVSYTHLTLPTIYSV